MTAASGAQTRAACARTRAEFLAENTRAATTASRLRVSRVEAGFARRCDPGATSGGDAGWRGG
jgi:hypothetical protein